jgi:hypothetical protein
VHVLISEKKVVNQNVFHKVGRASKRAESPVSFSVPNTSFCGIFTHLIFLASNGAKIAIL